MLMNRERQEILIKPIVERESFEKYFEVPVNCEDCDPGYEANRPDEESRKAPNDQLLDFFLSLKLGFPE